MNKRRFVLKEDFEDETIPVEFPVDEVDILPVLPEEEPIVDAVPEEIPEEVAVSAYTDMLQDLLRKQWDVINSADSIIATISAEEATGVNNEDVKAILKKFVEETTVSIGMVTKALGVVDPSQEELMDQGVEKAEEVINQEPDVVDELSEDIEKQYKFKITRTSLRNKPVNQDYGTFEVKAKNKFLAQKKALYQALQKDFDFDYKEFTDKRYEDALSEFKIEDNLNEDLETVYKADFSNYPYYTRYWMEEVLGNIESILDNYNDEDKSDERYLILDSLSDDQLEKLCFKVADVVYNHDWMWETINDCIVDDIYYELKKYKDNLNMSSVELNKESE